MWHYDRQLHTSSQLKNSKWGCRSGNLAQKFSNWTCHQRKKTEFSTPQNQLRALKMLSKPEHLNLSLTPGSRYNQNKESSLLKTREYYKSIYTQLNISRSFGWFFIFIKKYFLRIRQPTRKESSSGWIKTLINHMAYRQDKVCKQR